jgi:fatty acid synthase subunit alpha
VKTQEKVHPLRWYQVPIRERYMEMTYDTSNKDGNIKSLPLFADITARALQHNFTHRKRLLFATQFAQIALVVTSCAAFEEDVFETFGRA